MTDRLPAYVPTACPPSEERFADMAVDLARMRRERDEARAEVERLREEHAADCALWAAEEARITDERAALVRQLEDARSDFESANHDCARLIVAIRDAVHIDDMRELAENCAENGRAGWIEEALTDDHERRVQARETRTRELAREVERLRAQVQHAADRLEAAAVATDELLHAKGMWSQACDERDRLRAEAEGAITLSDEQMAAVRAVQRASVRLYSATDGCDPRWIRATDADGAREDLQEWRDAVRRLIDVGAPLSEGER